MELYKDYLDTEWQTLAMERRNKMLNDNKAARLASVQSYVTAKAERQFRGPFKDQKVKMANSYCVDLTEFIDGLPDSVRNNRKKLNKACYDFVKEEENPKGFIESVIFWFVARLVIGWIIDWVLKNWTD